MKGIVCGTCGYVALNGTAPEICPVCMSPKTAFEEKEDAINTPADENNLTDAEKKHVPVVVVNKACGLLPDCVDVQVKMGEIIHPMEKEHYIVYMNFYLDKEFIARVALTPENLNPAGGIHLKAKSGKLSVIEFCNIHGSWITEVDL